MDITYTALATSIPEIEEILGHRFQNRQHLITAFVHTSFLNENPFDVQESNERLEFLGDAVLGLLLSDHLFKTFPQASEGSLSNLRAYLVEGGACATYLQALGLEKFLLVGKGERLSTGRGRATMLADLFEALLGAIYLDGGLDAARNFFFNNFRCTIESALETPLHNWKAELQEYAQRTRQIMPTYRIITESGPDHLKSFEVVALLGEEIVGRGMGNSKKQAEQAAAQEAALKLFN